MTVTVTNDGLKLLLRDRYRTVCDDAVQELFLDMEANGPRSDKSGEHMTSLLEVTTETETDSSISRTIRSPAEYSSYVDEGTPPHPIFGNPLLAFEAEDGSTVIVHSVNHPGTQRTGWWTDRIARWVEYVARAMR